MILGTVPRIMLRQAQHDIEDWYDIVKNIQKTFVKNFIPAKIVMIAIPFLKISSLIFKWTLWPNFMAMKTGIIVQKMS